MQAKKFREMIFWAIVTVNGLLCLVSFWTSKLGLDTTTDSWLVATSVAFAGGSFAFVFWLFLSRRFPEASRNKKISYCLIVIVVGFLLFGFSTQWSVITLGGREAVSIHMQTVLSESDKQGIALLRQGSEEANLAPQLESLANQFEGYAKREAKGAFSGLTGEGDVVATLRNTAETFRSLAESVEKTESTRQGLYKNLQTSISEARDILTSEENLRTVNLKFSKKLSEINESLTRMAKTTSVEFVTTVNRNLSSLTIVTTERTSDQQRGAIKRLQTIITGAQDIVSKMTDQEELAEMDIQTFTMISMSNAVLKYGGEIFYAWAYALALDFAPFLFIILLAIARREEEKEITLEEAQQIKFDAETAAQGILNKAKEHVLTIIEELKPEITGVADSAKKALDEAATRVVNEVRDSINLAKKELEIAGKEQLQKLQDFKFKI